MKNKPFILCLAFVLLGLGAASAQKLKLASVDMQRLFNEYHRTAEQQQEINIERARIQKENNERLEEIRKIEESLATIRKELEDPNLSDKRRKDLMDESQRKFEDGNHAHRTRQEFLKRRNKTLNEKMVKRMRGILNEIKQLIEEKATAGDYDYIFDSSGNSNQGTPFLLYASETTDLTEMLLKELNADAEKEDDE